MKKIRNSILAIAALTALTAGAADLGKGLTVSGEAHVATKNVWRGFDVSQNNPSWGAGVKLKHTSGLFGSASIDTLRATAEDTTQYLSMFTGGYSYSLGSGITLAGGLKHRQFGGGEGISDWSHSDLFVSGSWQGLTATLSRTVGGADVHIAGLNRGDVLGEVSYTHKLGKFDVGGILGYSWYGSHTHGAKDSTTYAQLNAGYTFTPQFHVGVSYQLGGKDGYVKNNANDTAWLKATIGF